MQYLHSQKIIHKHLNPTKIIQTDDFRFKIIDFGGSCDINCNNQTEFDREHIVFYAPELFNTESYNEMVDVYSFAFVLLSIFAGKVINGSTGNYTDVIKSMPDFIIKLTAQCMSKDSSMRPSFDEILMTLQMNLFKLFEDVNSFYVFKELNQLFSTTLIK